ncbi:hypothetical protein ACOME3_009753 [Neoechinorhynchus agilis]
MNVSFSFDVVPWSREPVKCHNITQYNESLSDDCIARMLDQQSVDRQCYAIAVLGPMQCGYSLTHQILFILIGVGIRVLKMSDVADILPKMCKCVFSEMEIDSVRFDSAAADLLAEQIVVCSLIGHFHPHTDMFIDRILTFQSTELGCMMIEDQCSSHFTGVSALAMSMYLKMITHRPPSA